nr:Unknown Function [uncultured bacterium]
MTNIQYNSGAIDAPGCVGSGWELIKNNYWMYLGIAFVAYLMVSCIPIISLFLVGPTMVGILYTLFREMRGEPVDFGMMFKGFEKFVPAMVVGLIQSIPVFFFTIIQWSMDLGRMFFLDDRFGAGRRGEPDLGPLAVFTGAYFAILFGYLAVAFVWSILFHFALPLVAEHEISPVEAIKVSISAASGNIGGLIFLMILKGLILMAGAVMCGIGIFFVLPIIYAANAVAYRQVFPDLTPTVYRDVPPSPDVYGGTYGQGQ